MSYIKGVWQDHIVSRPYTYRMVQNTDGTITLIPAFGEIDQQGTDVTAARMNNIENGVESASNGVDALQTWRQGMDADANVQQAQAILSDVTDAEETLENLIASIPEDYPTIMRKLPPMAAADILRQSITCTMQNRWINGSREVYESAYYLLSDVISVDEYALVIPDAGYQVGALYYAGADDALGTYTGATGFRKDYVVLQPGKYYAVVFATENVSAKLDQSSLGHLSILYGYGKPGYTFSAETSERHSMGRIQQPGVYFFTNAELKAFPRSNELPSDIGSSNAILINTPYVYNGSRFTYQQLLTITDPIRAYTRFCYNGSVYQNWKAVPNASQMTSAIATAAGDAVTTAAANALTAINTSVYAGKKLSIYADSISTFKDWIPEGNATWYYTTGNGMPNGVEDSWWKKLLGAFGMTLHVNNAWSGRRVSGSESNAGWKQANVDVLAKDSTAPDVIIIEMGVNDFNSGATLGTYDGSAALPASASTFLDAYAIMLDRIMTTYPLAEVWCCGLLTCEYRNPRTFPEINSSGDSLATWNRAIEKLATAFGARMIHMDRCGITCYNLATYMGDYSDPAADRMVHPNAAGHSLMANQAIRDMDPGIKTRFS